MTTALVVLSATLLASLAIAFMWHKSPWLIALGLTVLLVIGGAGLKLLDGGELSWLGYSAFLALPVVSAIALLVALNRQRSPSPLHILFAVGLAALLTPFAFALALVWGEGL